MRLIAVFEIYKPPVRGFESPPESGIGAPMLGIPEQESRVINRKRATAGLDDDVAIRRIVFQNCACPTQGVANRTQGIFGIITVEIVRVQKHLPIFKKPEICRSQARGRRQRSKEVVQWRNEQG